MESRKGPSILDVLDSYIQNSRDSGEGDMSEGESSETLKSFEDSVLAMELVKAILGERVFLGSSVERTLRSLSTLASEYIKAGPPPEVCVAVGDSVGRFRCSGVPIGKRRVLIAGHCEASGLNRFVTTDEDATNPSRTYQVADSIRHRDFVGEPYFQNDIALLSLASDLDGDVEVLDFVDREHARRVGAVVMIGYGGDRFGTRRTRSVAIIADERTVIRDVYGRPVRYDKGLEFIGVPLGRGEDACAGDSGGPALVPIDGEWCLVGLVSRDAGRAYEPCGGGTVYVSLKPYSKWIKESG